MRRLRIRALAVFLNLAVAVLVPAAPGDLDRTFAGTGMKRLRFGFGDDFAYAVTVQPDGKVVVAGYSTVSFFFSGANIALVRYDTNNLPDPSFGDGGKAFVDFADQADNSAFALALDATDRVVVAGDAGGFFGVARLQGDPHLRILSLTRLPNGHAVLTGVGVPNQGHTIQGSANLSPGSFQPLGQMTTDDAGRWQFDDAGAANLSRRFYRLAFP